MTPPSSLTIILAPGLVEETVLRALPGRREEREFRAARDALYALPAGDRREKAFRELHAEWFDRLRLRRPLDDALADLPLLAETCERCVVTRAAERRDEGADLLVAEDGSTMMRTVALRLRPESLLQGEYLGAFLRAELLHVADMVDPEFGYEPELPETGGGPSHARLVRDRYRTLWNVRVAGLMERRGWLSPAIRESAEREFAATFPMLAAESEAAFDRFFAGAARTHAALLAFAVAPRASGGDPSGTSPGAPCPLCRFPTYALETERLPADVTASVQADFPAWHPSERLCRQCADLYRARSQSLAAAACLPGA